MCTYIHIYQIKSGTLLSSQLWFDVIFIICIFFWLLIYKYYDSLFYKISLIEQSVYSFFLFLCDFKIISTTPPLTGMIDIKMVKLMIMFVFSTKNKLDGFIEKRLECSLYWNKNKKKNKKPKV